MKEALAGVSVLAVGVLLLAWVIPDDQIRHPMWLFIFFVLVAIAVFCWRHPTAPTASWEWVGYIGGALLVGLILIAIDTLAYGLHSGHVILDFGMSILGAIVAASGYVRSLVNEAFPKQ